MRALVVAFSFLSRLPMPWVEAGERDFARAARLFPLVGLAVGGLVAAAGWAAGRLDPWLGALAALGAWVWVTGALHLDGLADLADGLGAAHRDRARMLTVMADPHIGSFGVVAVAMQLLAKLLLLHRLVPAGWPLLVLVPAAARIGPLLWARLLPPLKPGGLGAALSGASRWRDIAGWAALLAAAALALPPLWATLPLLPAFALWVRWRLGGITGDVHGAGIELVESGLLLVGVIWTHHLA